MKHRQDLLNRKQHDIIKYIFFRYKGTIKMKYIKITCPACNTLLIIDRINGKINEVRKPIIEQSTGDRFKDAFIKSSRQKADAENKFKKSAKAQQNRSESLNNLFKKSLEEIKKSGDATKPETPFDFD